MNAHASASFADRVHVYEHDHEEKTENMFDEHEAWQRKYPSNKTKSNKTTDHDWEDYRQWNTRWYAVNRFARLGREYKADYYICLCGTKVSLKSHSTHVQSKRHTAWVDAMIRTIQRNYEALVSSPPLKPSDR